MLRIISNLEVILLFQSRYGSLTILCCLVYVEPVEKGDSGSHLMMLFL